MKAAYIYEEKLAQGGFGPSHPLKLSRLQLAYELLQAYGVFADYPPLPPRPVEEAELLSFHDQDYVNAVRALSRGEGGYSPQRYGFSPHGDNPPYPGMYEAALLPVGASLRAAELLAQGQAQIAFNPAGGLHHAAPHFASGFCIFNDAAIAIHYLLGKGMRVAYVDIDAHHGDGVQAAFYDTSRVLTISLHEWGRFLFPGSGEVEEMGEGEGRGYSVNVPLYPMTDDEIYLWAFREVVPPLVQAFSPDVLVTQLGCDTHYLDPLTHLALTTRGYSQVVRELKGLAPCWLALGGGGYDQGAVARCWALAYALMLGQELPDDIPPSFARCYGLTTLHDPLLPPPSESSRSQAQRFAHETVAQIKRLIFPLHHL